MVAHRGPVALAPGHPGQVGVGQANVLDRIAGGGCDQRLLARAPSLIPAALHAVQQGAIANGAEADDFVAAPPGGLEGALE